MTVLLEPFIITLLSPDFFSTPSFCIQPEHATQWQRLSMKYADLSAYAVLWRKNPAVVLIRPKNSDYLRTVENLVFCMMPPSCATSPPSGDGAQWDATIQIYSEIV